MCVWGAKAVLKWRGAGTRIGRFGRKVSLMNWNFAFAGGENKIPDPLVGGFPNAGVFNENRKEILQANGVGVYRRSVGP